jgi:heme A synthase
MTLTNVHDRLSVTIVLYLFILAAWGLWRYFRKQGPHSSFWGALVICEVLILVQGLLGIFLWSSSLRPERGAMHILYGIVTAISIPAVYAYTRGRDTRREMLIYALVLIAVIGLAGRAIITGR